MDTITKEEALGIINKTDSRHEAYYKNDKSTVDAVNRSFEISFPGDYGSELPPHIEKAMESSLRELGHTPQASADDPAAQQGQPYSWAPEWEYTLEQSEATLSQEWGPLDYPSKMAAVKDPANFEKVFGGFIKTENDKRFLRELFSQMGNHPAGFRLYLHLLNR